MTLDANTTALNYAIEQSLGVLPGTPNWTPVEPNSYGDFGAQYSMVARNPINPNRQRRKGKIADLDAAVNITLDVTNKAARDFLQGFLYANWRTKTTKLPSAVTSTLYTVTTGTDFSTTDLIFASGFANAANNGLKKPTATASTSVTVSGLVAEASPPTGASIKRVGVEGASGDITLTNSGGVITLGSTALNWVNTGLIPGDWIYIGGDVAANQFATASNNGFARVKSVAATAVVLDKTQGTIVTDTGAGKTIRVFMGDTIKSELAANIVRSSFQFERYMGPSMYEYVVGAVANTLKFTFNAGDKVTAEMGFMGLNSATATVAKSGNRLTLPTSDAYVTSIDFSRIRLADSADTGLATVIKQFDLTITNNVSSQKAIGTLGAIDMAEGDFQVSGNITAYFGDLNVINAIKNNSNCTLDFAMAVNNQGLVIDLPLVAIGDGRVKIEKDQAITLPITLDAAQHATLGHTMLVNDFAYLPNAAM